MYCSSGSRTSTTRCTLRILERKLLVSVASGMIPPMVFTNHIEVRVSDLDMQGHVTGAAYHQYADHSRFACVQAAGISVERMLAAGFGPVNLETMLRFQRELRAGDSVEVSCDWIWDGGKTFRVEHVLTRGDGEVAATVSHVSGLLDLAARRLVPDPAAQWRKLASRPELLALSDESSC